MPTERTDTYVVEMKDVNKAFPGCQALDNVSFNLKPGEVMALLGENGAGKSTLVKVISGVYTRDSGEMIVFGESVGHLSPKEAQEMGIAIIHQELHMCRHLTVTENIFLGREETRGGLLSNRKMRRRAKEVIDELNIRLDPDAIVDDLSISQQQMVEIAKALATDAQILIMDEPTSALSSTEIEELFDIIRRLRDSGKSIIYISHRLDELKQIADRVTIMRDGQYILTEEYSKLTQKDIITNMVGREIKEQYPTVQVPRGKKVMEVKDLNAGTLVQDINFDVYEGEVLGIAGLMGAGRTETTRAIFGIDPKETGEIILDGEAVTIHHPSDAIKAGVVLVPEDRKRDGLCTDLSIRENIALPNLDILSNAAGVVNRKHEAQMVQEARSKLDVRMHTAEADASSLSGGNQQKVVVGKWLVRDSRMVIFDEPTRGIDVAAKVEIYNLINQLKEDGIGVMFVSSEMPEVLGIADRILVMCEGRITAELDPKTTTQEEILEYATMFETKISQTG